MAKNPKSLNQDPEFRALNPGLDDRAREAAATVLSLSESSDVISSLTAYVAADAEASAFVRGKADPWGMVVNPSYRAVRLPVHEWPLLDTFVPRSTDECLAQVSTPYLTQIAAPVTSLRKIAEAVLDGWPNVQTKCTRSSSTDPWKMGRVDRQGVGSRFMLGIVSLGDAERLDLRTASLQTRVTRGSGTAFTSAAGRTFVAPTDGSIKAAVRTAVPSKDGLGPFTLGPGTTAADPRAYPATMVVYTAARLEGMRTADARKVAQFVRVATRDGQVRGSANGQLPAGFVPITRTGTTSALWRQAQRVADAVAAQKGVAGDRQDGDGGADDADGAAGGSPSTTPGGSTAPVADAPGAAAAGPAGAQPATAVQTAPTAATTSSTGRLLMVGLVAALLLAGLGAPGLRLAAMLRGRR
jgi:hypothetical protein